MKTFDAAKEVRNIVSFIRDYYEKYHLKGAVIGISGGKDSAVSAALFTRALGKENVIGVALPCHSNEQDEKDAKRISSYYDFPLYRFDLTETFDVFRKGFYDSFGALIQHESELVDSDINLKPRLRMAACYYIGAFFSQLKGQGYLVVGNSNKSERYVGYFTKGGDNVSDIAVLADYTVEEVIKIGEYLEVPREILYKKPSDGLSHMTDEEKLGLRYKDIATYMEDATLLDPEIQTKIASYHHRNEHKWIDNYYQRRNQNE